MIKSSSIEIVVDSGETDGFTRGYTEHNLHCNFNTDNIMLCVNLSHSVKLKLEDCIAVRDFFNTAIKNMEELNRENE